MKQIINPKYKQAGDFINSVPQIFETQGTSIYKGRNELKTYETGGCAVVVKSFRKPHLVNRFVYGFFRPSKARRSYEYAFELLKRGVKTPEPIAYIEEKKFGLLTNSYYFCIYERDFVHIRSYMTGEKTDDVLMENLVGFIAEIHDKGVLFLDMSPGNILCKAETGGFVFSLVDINRMKFKTQLSEKERYKNLKRLSNSGKTIEKLISRYARICGFDPAYAVRKVQKYSACFENDYHE
jgi:hypothetical protein